MSVPVLFPDGTQRRVMAELRLNLGSVPGIASSRFVLCPINADPKWKYLWRNGRWLARPRFGSLTSTPVGEMPPWWAGIAIMADEDTATSRKDAIGPHRRAA